MMFCVFFFHKAIKTLWQRLKYLNKLICINELIDTSIRELLKAETEVLILTDDVF